MAQAGLMTDGTSPALMGKAGELLVAAELTHRCALALLATEKRRPPKGAAKFREETSCRHDQRSCCRPTLPRPGGMAS
jgi:hypothetical protein